MDRLKRYREIATQVVEEYSGVPVANGEIEPQAFIDRERDHYAVVLTGWDRNKRVYFSSIHFDIRDGKFWVQHDATDRPVVEALEDAGVPKSDIVIAFHPPKLRKHAEYAVG